MTVKCDRCGGNYPPDPNHPDFPAPHNCIPGASKDYQQVVGSAVDAVDLFIPSIKAAVAELEAKHGPLTPNLLRAYAIFVRESGEVADAILDVTKAAAAHQNGVAIPEGIMEQMTQHLGHEIAQCMAVLTYMLINVFGDKIQTATEAPNLVPGNDKVQ